MWQDKLKEIIYLLENSKVNEIEASFWGRKYRVVKNPSVIAGGSYSKESDKVESNLGLEEQAVELGNRITKGQRICYIESGYTYDEIVSEFDGEVDEIFFKHGETNDATDLSIYNFSVFNYDARISRESCSFCGCQAESCKL